MDVTRLSGPVRNRSIGARDLTAVRLRSESTAERSRGGFCRVIATDSPRPACTTGILRTSDRHRCCRCVSCVCSAVTFGSRVDQARRDIAEALCSEVAQVVAVAIWAAGFLTSPIP